MNAADPTPSHERSPLRRIFFPPDEGRLRSGWRLLIHGLLTFVLVTIFATILIGLAVWFGNLRVNQETLASLDSPYLLVGQASAIVLATWLARRFLDRRSLTSLGLHWDEQALPDLLFGTLMPAGLFGMIFLIELAVGWLEVVGSPIGSVPFPSLLASLLQGFLLFVLVGVSEEVLSRGYHLQNLAESLGLPLGVFISSAVFSVLHIFNPNPSFFSMLGILAAGFFLALGWLRTGQLWLPIGIHIGWNYFQGPIFGFPVSGLEGFHLLEHTVTGPALITGGGFGPEAGLLGLLAMALGAYAVWRYTEGRTGPLGEDRDDAPEARRPGAGADAGP